MGKQIIIGMNGVAQSGKDTAAQALIERLGFVRVSFADPLRQMLYNLNPVIVVPHDFAVENRLRQRLFDLPASLTLRGAFILRLADFVDMVGWGKAKTLPEVRHLLQRQGTEAGRDVLGDTIWIDTAFKEVKKHERVVITDVRFPNEALAVDAHGGFVVRVSRPGYEPVNGHISDCPLDAYMVDFEVFNGGDITDLHRSILGTFRAIEALNAGELLEERSAA